MKTKIIIIGIMLIFMFGVVTVLGDTPIQTNPYPINNSEGISVDGSAINIYLSDNDADTMNVSVWSNHTGVWVHYAWYPGINVNNHFINDFDHDGDWELIDVVAYGANGGWQLNGTRAFKDNRTVTHSWGMTSYNTIYYWSVNVTDGTNWNNETYKFITEIETNGESNETDKLRNNPALNDIEKAIVGVVGVVILLGFLSVVMKMDYKKEGSIAKILIGILIALTLLTIIFTAL